MTAPPEEITAALAARYPDLKPADAERAAAVLLRELAGVIRSVGADGFIQPLPDGWIEIRRVATEGAEEAEGTRSQ
jgi:hypothetical protein